MMRDIVQGGCGSSAFMMSYSFIIIEVLSDIGYPQCIPNATANTLQSPNASLFIHHAMPFVPTQTSELAEYLRTRASFLSLIDPPVIQS